MELSNRWRVFLPVFVSTFGVLIMLADFGGEFHLPGRRI